MKNRGKINISQLGFVMSPQEIGNKFKDPIFLLSDGTPIYPGDTVEFFINDQIFTTSGIVENINGLRVAVFNQLLNKWQYFEIIK